MPNAKTPLRIIYFILALAVVSIGIFIKSLKYFSSVLSSWDISKKSITTLVLGGDVMLGRSVNTRLTRTNDYAWPFRYIGELFMNADLAYVNLESPLTTSCVLTDSGMKLCGHTNNVAALLAAGIDIVSLANNHALDYGDAGLIETQQVLAQNNIQATGVGEIVVKDVGGFKVAFVSFNDVNNLRGIDSTNASTLQTRLDAASSLADFIVATFHWGREYESNPTSRQVGLARQAVDLGADLVVGAHPHWIQTKEVYQGVPIYYSLGNTIFDQEWSEPTKTGLVIKVYIQDNVINKIDELVLYSSNYGQPRWLNK